MTSHSMTSRSMLRVIRVKRYLSRQTVRDRLTSRTLTRVDDRRKRKRLSSMLSQRRAKTVAKQCIRFQASVGLRDVVENDAMSAPTRTRHFVRSMLRRRAKIDAKRSIKLDAVRSVLRQRRAKVAAKRSIKLDPTHSHTDIHADSPVTEPCSDDENKNESDDVIAPESDANSKSLVQHDYDWYTTLVRHPLFRTKHPL